MYNHVDIIFRAYLRHDIKLYTDILIIIQGHCCCGGIGT